MKKALFALTIVASLTSQAFATDKWLDVNGTGTADSGVTAASTITWNTAVSQWNTDSTGGVGTISGWTSGVADRAFFAAGGDATVAYTVNLPSALTAGSVFVEEGTITKGGAALTVNQIDIASGASLVYNASGGILPTGTTPAVTLHGTGATFGYTSGGVGGTFLSTTFGIILDGGGTLTDSVGNPNVYGGVISGTGDLVKTGPGILRLTATSTYSGSTIVNNGTLRLRTTNAAQIPNTDLIVNGTGGFDGATFTQTVQSLSGNGKLPYSGSGVLTIAGTASTTFSGVTSGSGRINVNKSGGTGTLTLTGVNLSSGRFTVTLGNVIVDAAASLGGDIMDLHVDGGTLTLNQAAESVENLNGAGGSIVLNNAALSLVVDPAANSINSSVISGAGGLTKVNVISLATVRTQTLAGNNTYDGNTFVKGGILSVQHASALGSTTGFTEVNKVGTVEAELLFTTAAASVTTFEPLRISGPGASDNGAIAVTNGATPTISGPVTLIGDSTITVSGTASVLYNNANAFTSAANENLTLQGGAGTSPLGIGTISGAIALGSGSLTKLQGGVWVLGGTNTYSGFTNINAGTLSVSNIANQLGSNTIVNMGSTTTGGNLTYTGTGETTAKIINLAGTTGGAFLIQSGTGNLQYTSDLTATGVGAKTLTLQGSTAGTGEITGKIVDGSGTTSVAKSGSGTWTLGANNSYTGATSINAGTLAVSDIKDSGTNSNLGAGAAINLGSNITTGTLKYAGLGDTTNRAINLAGTTGGGTIDQSGTGLLKFSADLTTTGAGIKTLTLTGSTAGTGELSGAIVDNTVTNTTAVTKSGTGKWTLSGASTYSGGTTVSAGALLVNNTTGSGTGSGPVTVSAGVLGGTGTVGGSIANSGVIAPGNGGIGTLKVTGNVTQNAAAIWHTELSGATTDLLEVTGDIDLSALGDFLSVTGTGTGSSWTIGTYTGNLSGTFDNITSGYSVNYGDGNNDVITLNAVPSCVAGDYNCDTHVDAGDYASIRKDFSDITTGAGLAAYDTWRSNFGVPPGAGSGGGLGNATVPEPSAIVLLAIGLFAGAIRRRG